jgi:hypothetical protein
MEPKRFRIDNGGEMVAYGVMFEGELPVIQDLTSGGWGRPHPVPSLDVFKRIKKMPEAVMVWIDEDSSV